MQTMDAARKRRTPREPGTPHGERSWNWKTWKAPTSGVSGEIAPSSPPSHNIGMDTGPPPPSKGKGFFPDPSPCKGSRLCGTIRAQRERKVSKGMARKTKSTSVPEAPEAPVAPPVSGQAAPVPEATRESEESTEPEAAEATRESGEPQESRESGKPVSTPSAPKPARPLQPTVKDELDDPFGMVGFLD